MFNLIHSITKKIFDKYWETIRDYVNHDGYVFLPQGIHKERMNEKSRLMGYAQGYQARIDEEDMEAVNQDI